MSPQPFWAKNRVEIYTEPEYIEDSFRLWVVWPYNLPVSYSLVNIDDIAGDYAAHMVEGMHEPKPY